MNAHYFRQAARRFRELFPHARPVCSLILGSGWNTVANTFKLLNAVDYAQMPGLGQTQVEGHEGRLLLAEVAGAHILIFQGRRHWYEGDGWEAVALPVYLTKETGATTMILTNASGGIREDLSPGDIMLLTDHINAMGVSPLRGKHDPYWGNRFPDQSQVYNPELRGLFMEAARQTSTALTSGVYLATAGPAYETPAEVRAFRALGADAVGMSTVPEAMLANATGLRVAGLSCISNKATGLADAPLSHEDVLATLAATQHRMGELLRAFFELALAGPLHRDSVR